MVLCDHGTACTSVALDHWAYGNQVRLDFSRPGKPVNNGVGEACNGSVRRACLSRHCSASIAEATSVLETWRQDDTNHRPHRTLGQQPPAVYRRAGIFEPRTVRLINERMRVAVTPGTPPTARTPA